MKPKKEFCLEDLLVNESFLNYYFRKNEADIWEWEEFQEENPELQHIIDEAIESLNRLSLKWNEEQIRQKFYQLKRKLDEEGETKVVAFRPFYQIAVGLAATIAILIGAWWMFVRQDVSPIYKELVTDKTLIEKVNEGNNPMLVMLSDGSSILLQKNSRLSYPKQFSGDKREVYLDGEAFFEIAKNPQKPFMVYANEIVTKVIGTSFTIKAPHGEKDIKVIVRTGKVSVYRLNEIKEKATKTNLEGVVITQNQQIIFDKKQINFSKSLIDEPQILQQTQPFKFDFNDESAAEVFKTIQKAYGVTIVFDEELMKDCPITASLSDEPLYGKIELVCQAIEAEYEVIDGQIIINSRGCK
ncbi:MAG: FecR family protein [Spirosomataceae bacterium]